MAATTTAGGSDLPGHRPRAGGDKEPVAAHDRQGACLPRMDKDADGIVTLEEYLALIRELGTRLDANGAMPSPMAEPPAASLGARSDKNGKVSPPERDSLFNPPFERHR